MTDRIDTAADAPTDPQSKLAKQRNEIARLTQLCEKLIAEKAALLDDIKWMRGETDHPNG